MTFPLVGRYHVPVEVFLHSALTRLCLANNRLHGTLDPKCSPPAPS